MSQRNLLIVVAVVVVIGLIGYSQGWFGGAGDAPAEQSEPASG